MAVVDVQVASTHATIPDAALFTAWVEATLKHNMQALDREVSIRIIDRDESQALNYQYRHQDKPTNVLSFSCDLPADVDLPLLGDLAICADIVACEACDQKKTLESHWAHMVVHGTMHLLGFDHVDAKEAEHMEAYEVAILASLGHPSPY